MSMTIDTTDGTGAETPTVPAVEPSRRRKGLPRRKTAAVPPIGAELIRPKRRGRRRKWVAAGLAVVLLAGGGTAWALTRGGTTAAAPTSRTITDTISTGSVSKSVQASGTVEAANVADLTFPSAGTVSSVKVTVGETVTKGQALASINPTSLSLAVNSAQASYNQAAAQLSSAQANLAADNSAMATLRATPTTSTGSTGATGATGATGTSGTTATTTAAQLATEEQNEQVQIDSADAQIAGDESSLSGAQDKLNSAQADLAGATITAPIAGVVSAVNVSVGDSVSGSGSGGSGGAGSHGTGSSAVSPSSSTSSSAAVEVVNMKAWVVNATVSGADLDSIKVGQEATITTTGSSTPVFGTVASVGVTASSSSGGAAQFPVTINVTGDPTTLHPGDTATVAITTQQLNNVLTVPTAALSQNSSGQTVVSKLVNGAPQQVVVTLGASYGQQTVVTSGLASGDQVQFTITGLAGRTGTARTGTGTGRTGTGTGRTGTGTGTGTGAGTTGGFGGFGGGGFAGGAG
ncbi:MAG TPA: HlyD family efflux transporter periplasmic adaptor subunit [Sporichthyaceae bacterium]|jgi:multidrug efflux pump subunit AcrA (membrane-fusion protein)|nr:HlyD family efflux transporter periplasmic adaptor subunit [Sporichthyaceae bacterium]